MPNQPNLAEIWVEFAQGAISRKYATATQTANEADQLLALFLQRYIWTNIEGEWAWCERQTVER